MLQISFCCWLINICQHTTGLLIAAQSQGLLIPPVQALVARESPREKRCRCWWLSGMLRACSERVRNVDGARTCPLHRYIYTCVSMHVYLYVELLRGMHFVIHFQNYIKILMSRYILYIILCGTMMDCGFSMFKLRKNVKQVSVSPDYCD